MAQFMDGGISDFIRVGPTVVGIEGYQPGPGFKICDRARAAKISGDAALEDVAIGGKGMWCRNE
jgi:hypothetical protein